jgi:rubrerythrin
MLSANRRPPPFEDARPGRIPDAGEASRGDGYERVAHQQKAERGPHMSIKGTKTEQNLLKAFAGESQARNRYTFFSTVAKKDGFEQICALFLETAENEKEHAKVFFCHLEGGDAEITATYPAGRIGSTAENLLAAAEGEKMEWGTLYPDFAATAAAEGFADVAESFRQIAEVEEKHEKRYRKLLENVTMNQVFTKDAPIRWKCRNCGYVHEGTSAPSICPACKHPQSYYEVFTEPY